ncbi:unnamed protein product, partial [Bubo scandiacus]
RAGARTGTGTRTPPRGAGGGRGRGRGEAGQPPPHRRPRLGPSAAAAAAGPGQRLGSTRPGRQVRAARGGPGRRRRRRESWWAPGSGAAAGPACTDTPPHRPARVAHTVASPPRAPGKTEAAGPSHAGFRSHAQSSSSASTACVYRRHTAATPARCRTPPVTTAGSCRHRGPLTCGKTRPASAGVTPRFASRPARSLPAPSDSPHSQLSLLT